jgi:hypothetical protein
MKLESIKEQLHFDEVVYVKNPYFYIRDYEDKGAIVVLKKEKNVDVPYKQLKNVCFECPDLEHHEGIIRMVIFSVGSVNQIKSYSIGASKYKILRSDIEKYEKLMGEIIEVI